MNFKELNEKEWGYLFGLFEGDGYKIYDKKSRHYQIEFYLNSERDKKIIFFLTSLLSKLESNFRIYQDKRFKCKRIQIYSKELFNIIAKNIDFREKNKDF